MRDLYFRGNAARFRGNLDRALNNLREDPGTKLQAIAFSNLERCTF